MVKVITLYSPNTTVFSNNGLGVLMPVKAVVIEELNGIYELEMLCYAHSYTNNQTWKLLSEMYIIRAPAPSGNQLFRIYKVKKKLDGSISVNARHIFYDGLSNNLDSLLKGIMTADTVIKELYSRLNYPTPFSVSSSIFGTADIELNNINPVAALLGRGGLVDIFNGELFRHNFLVELRQSAEIDRGFVVRFRKNLIGLDYEISIENTTTRIKPQAYDSRGEPIYLPEVYIDSPRISSYPFPLVSLMILNDIRVGNEMTLSQGHAEMRKRVTDFYCAGGDLPSINAKVDFILLRQAEHYNQFAPFEHINLGDIVTIKHEELNIDLKAKCIKYVYDSILERYEHIELGDFRDNFVAQVDRNFNNISRSMSGIRNSDLPPGGTTGQVLKKLSNANGDVGWRNI